jgi:hypothetical protein
VIVVNSGQWDLGWASKELEELQKGRGIPLLQMSSDLHTQVAKQTPPKPQSPKALMPRPCSRTMSIILLANTSLKKYPTPSFPNPRRVFKKCVTVTE